MLSLYRSRTAIVGRQGARRTVSRSRDALKEVGPEPDRVLAVYEPGSGGPAVLDEAARLLGERGELTVLTLATQAEVAKCCGSAYAPAYNRAVREAAADELVEAQRLLGPAAERAQFVTLVEGRDPPLIRWVAARDYAVIVLSRRGRPLTARLRAARLRRSGRAKVRLVPRKA